MRTKFLSECKFPVNRCLNSNYEQRESTDGNKRSSKIGTHFKFGITKATEFCNKLYNTHERDQQDAHFFLLIYPN
jgi:hypothetical protein